CARYRWGLFEYW
nr:immunoglobulin heavy chain junction region [Mus musculus]